MLILINQKVITEKTLHQTDSKAYDRQETGSFDKLTSCYVELQRISKFHNLHMAILSEVSP